MPMKRHYNRSRFWIGREITAPTSNFIPTSLFNECAPAKSGEEEVLVLLISLCMPFKFTRSQFSSDTQKRKTINTARSDCTVKH